MLMSSVILTNPNRSEIDPVGIGQNQSRDQFSRPISDEYPRSKMDARSMNVNDDDDVHVRGMPIYGNLCQRTFREWLQPDIVCHPINTSGTVVIYLPAQPDQHHRGERPCGDIGRKGIAKKTTIVHVSVLLHGIGDKYRLFHVTTATCRTTTSCQII